MPNPDPRFYVPTEALERLAGTALFYPHSAGDLKIPIRMFAPYITDFWFADLAYFGERNPADRARPVLHRHPRYRLEGTPKLTGIPAAERERRYDERFTPPKSYLWIEPCVLTETYTHLPTNRQIRIHRRRGFSYSAFMKEEFTLGVFFYRRDSLGGDGSNMPWLTMYDWKSGRFLGQVLDRLVDGGLLVTDGVNMGWPKNRTNKVYGELHRYTWLREGPSGQEAMQNVQPFTDHVGRQFTCIGYADQGYGPTLVWQVTKPAQ